jgi:hypothetical protein
MMRLFRSLIQILDCEMYELMHAHGDYTHFYFCYRWFLLDFKRELLYQDVSHSDERTKNLLRALSSAGVCRMGDDLGGEAYIVVAYGSVSGARPVGIL